MNYAFRCNDCGKQFEITESLAEHEKHEETCPDCGSSKIERHFDEGGAQVQTSKKS